MPPLAPIDPLTGVCAARFAVYVHFPFCLSKCPYCDFASQAAQRVPEERYTAAVERELCLRFSELSPREVHSIYFGGGTPSLWSPRCVGRVLERIARHFPLARGAEVSLEANPGASDAERFSGYRAAGVNRLSIGIQSFHPSTLAALGRVHDERAALDAVEKARRAGFDNLSLDFIYGVHGQTLKEVEEDARQAAGLGSEHLSAYALTLERALLAEEVPLQRRLSRGELALPGEEDLLAMARAVRETFQAAGFQRYEISNYAHAGYHSRHNAAYWTGGEYLALGAGAAGYLSTGAGSGERYANLRSAEKYLDRVEADELPEAGREQLTSQELFEERVAMGLRLTGGVELAQACRLYGVELGPRLKEAERLVALGVARFQEGRLALTDRGLDLHSEIAARLI